MQNITSLEDLKFSIALLEDERKVKKQLMKDQFVLIYENLKPANLIRNTLKEISSSPYLIDNIPGTAIGLLGGFLSKKIFVGKSGNLTRKFLGSVLQFGVTNIVANNTDILKPVVKILSHIFANKVLKSKNRVI